METSNQDITIAHNWWPFQRCNCGGGIRRVKKPRCQSVVVSKLEKPELAIYGQIEEMRNGNNPSWDNPDIITNDWGPFRLKKEAEVKVRNLSHVAAINAKVHFYTAPFGIGMPKTLKSSRKLNIPGHNEVVLNFPFDQETLSGDQKVGVHIEIEHIQDTNPVNNFGSQIHDGGYTTESGRKFDLAIPVLNAASVTREIILTILPTDLIANIVPAVNTLGPFEQTSATLHIEIPDSMHGAPESPLYKFVTVLGKSSDGELVGGVTRLIRINE